MKKNLFIFIVLILITTSTIFAQSDTGLPYERISYLIDRCLPLLGKPVPSGFQSIGRDNYGFEAFRNNENIGVYTNNNRLIDRSMVMIPLPPDYETLNIYFVTALSLLIQRYNFENFTDLSESISNTVTLSRGEIIVTVNYQTSNSNMYLLIIGFSDRILTF